MPIRFRCPQCDKLLSIGTRKSGSQVNCPICDRSLTVPHRTEVDLVIKSAPSRCEKKGMSDSPLPAQTRIEPAMRPALPAPKSLVSASLFSSRKRAWFLAGGVAVLLIAAATQALLLRPALHETPRPQQQMAQTAGLGEMPQIDPQPKPDPDPPAVAVAEEEPSEPSKPDKPPVPEKEEGQPVALPIPTPTGKPYLPVEPIKPPAPAGKFVVKYRRERTEDQLLRQIDTVPELALDRGKERTQARRAVALAHAAKQKQGHSETVSLLVKNRADLDGLPFIMGDDCHLTLTAAEHLQDGSVALRAHLTAASAQRAPQNADSHPDPKKLHDLLMEDSQGFNKWLRPEAIPALQQLLMAENQATREVLVEQLSHIDSKRASRSLAQHALFDLHPSVRARALSALAKRPHAEYQALLLAGFRHPWPAVADHAAEALVALDRRDAVPALLGLLDEPHPAAPYRKPGRKGAFVREMVCLNHFRNCLLCHPASLNNDDKVRGAVPQPNQPLAGGGGGYGAQPQSIFVRADVTYLRQDFSVLRPVEKSGPWPTVQRFDYLVRERPATLIEVWAAREIEADGPSEHQKAIFFALRELTGADPGPSVEDWKRLFLPKAKAMRVRSGFQCFTGVAADRQGRVWVSADREILLKDPDASFGPWFKEIDSFKGLALDPQGRLIACQPGKGRLIAIDPDKRTLEVLAHRYKDEPLHAPSHLVIDRGGGVYFTDAGMQIPGNALGIGGAVYYLSAQRTLTRLPIELPEPAGIALSPDQRTLYLTCAGTRDVMAYPLEGVGLPGEGRVLGKLETRGDTLIHAGGGLTVDGQGNVFLANAALRAIQVFNSEGAHLGLISLPDAPLACTIGGVDGRTLHVVSRHALYKVQLDNGLNLARKDE